MPLDVRACGVLRAGYESRHVQSGDVIAQKYRLDRQLGAGGMGMVWAATHMVTHKSLALKFIIKKIDDPGARRRALREARAVCAVVHPNVVAVHDVIEDDDGMPILVMDLLRGESLATRLERERVLSPDATISVVRPVLSALSVAHEVGIVHRDLKPDNIFIVDGEVVKILDFGVAKLSGKDAATKETNRLTETGAMVGTPHYMSPEQAFGESDVDLRADLFSLGAVMYECLSGALPTDGQNLGQILKALATGAIHPIAERVPSLDPALASVVDRLLRIDRAERPASATDALALLDAVGTGTNQKLVTQEPPANATSARSSHVTPTPATRDATAEKKSGGPRWAALAVAAGLAIAGGTAFTAVRSHATAAPSSSLSAAAVPTTTETIAPIASNAPAISAMSAPSAAPATSEKASVSPLGSARRPSGRPAASAPPSASLSPKATGGNRLLNDAPF